MPSPTPPTLSLSLVAAACCLIAWGSLPAAAGEATANPAAAPEPPSAPAGLDTGAVHAEYLDGNFENVVSLLESYRRRHPAHSRGDSLFIARHLAVVYSADPKTGESGRSWMRRLATLSPSADLAGMYASASIESAFAAVRAEVRARSRRGRWLWIGAGGTALAAATALLIIAAQSGDGTNSVPVDL